MNKYWKCCPSRWTNTENVGHLGEQLQKILSRNTRYAGSDCGQVSIRECQTKLAVLKYNKEKEQFVPDSKVFHKVMCIPVAYHSNISERKFVFSTNQLFTPDTIYIEWTKYEGARYLLLDLTTSNHYGRIRWPHVIHPSNAYLILWDIRGPKYRCLLKETHLKTVTSRIVLQWQMNVRHLFNSVEALSLWAANMCCVLLLSKCYQSISYTILIVKPVLLLQLFTVISFHKHAYCNCTKIRVESYSFWSVHGFRIRHYRLL